MAGRERGVYGKYILHKADGTPCDPEACYFVLRLDRDTNNANAARAAMIVYARLCGKTQLARDIRACIEELDCSDHAHHCGITHVPPVQDPVWRYKKVVEHVTPDPPDPPDPPRPRDEETKRRREDR